MPLESVTHISDLVVTNPTSTDPKSEGDNHLRNLKTALKTDFPNISGPVTKTHTQLNNTLDKTGDTMTGPLAQAAGTAALPSYTFTGDTNTGIWSPGADIVAIGTGGIEGLRVDASRTTTMSAAAAGAVDSRAVLSSVGNGGTNRGVALTFAPAGSANSVEAVRLIGYQGVAAATATAAAFAVQVANSGAVLTEALRVDNGLNVLVTGSGGLGYGVGSGGTVTQATSRTTGVTLNKPSGAITLFSTTTTAGTFSSFTLTNSSIAATDGVEVCFASGATANSYGLLVTAVAAGSCRIQIHNIAAVGVAEAPVIQFRVIKGATS